MIKPTVIPEFAKDDVVDGTTGENNVEEPTTEAKSKGWIPAFTHPFRGWMNWLHRYYYLWIKWLDEELDPRVTSLEAGNPFIKTGQIEAAHISTTYFATHTSFNILWSKYADMVTLYFPDIFGAGASGMALLRIEPDTAWSDDILSGVSVPHQYLPVVVRSSVGTQVGSITLPEHNTGYFQVRMVNSSAVITSFPSDGSGRGWYEFSITFKTLSNLLP